MEIEVIEENPKKIVFELRGESHTLVNTLKTELWKNKHVKTATYSLKHPLLGIPKMVVETDGAKPRAVIVEACKKIVGTADDFRKAFSRKA